MVRIFHALRRIEEFVLAWSIIAIAVLLVGNVICRSVFGFSLAFAEELARFLMIAVTFVGLSYAAGRGRHIRMTAFYDQLPARWRKGLMVMISATTCLLLLVVAGYAVRYMATVHFLDTRSPVLQVRLVAVYLFVPLGLVSAAVQYGLTAAKNLRERDVYLSFDQRDEYLQDSAEKESRWKRS